MSMSINLLKDFAKIVRWAIQNPTDKAAAQIAIDGLNAWEDISTRPSIVKLEADIGAYIATMPPAAAAAQAPEVDPPSSVQPTDDRSDHSHGSLMNPAL